MNTTFVVRIGSSALVLLSWLSFNALAQDAVIKHITQGRAKTLIENLYKCPVKVGNHRIAGVGQITATDGTVITVPAETALQKGAKLHGADLYNECNQITPAKASDVSTDKVPVVEIDADGDIVTGYIVADNFFELYVNGKLVAADNTPFTPFNSVIVKFKAKRPYTYASKIVRRRALDLDAHPGVRQPGAGAQNRALMVLDDIS
jgi:hypothetical protein